MSVVIERELETMPFDKAFELSDGNYELCHSTGKEVDVYGDGEFWNEYVDSNGDLHYGR